MGSATENAATARPTWSVRLLDGPLAGSTWPLGELPTVVGRGLGCHVRLDDPRVSRNHFELRSDVDGVRLRHLSERNPTLINGEESSSGKLHAGDVIEIAGYHMAVVPGALAEDQATVPGRTTISMHEAIHTQPTFDAPKYRSSPDLTQDLHTLLQLVRQLSREDSVDGLVERLRSHLAERLPAARCWVGWRAYADDEIALYPPASPEETRRAPMALMLESCRTCEGLLPPPEEGAAYIVAPLMHGTDSFGAIAASQTASEGFDQRQLNYIVAVAECAAPLVRGVERLEQLRRDEAARAPKAMPHVRMLGASPGIERLRSEIRRAALSRANVLIVGETGVGKELAARTLHDLGPRASGPYVTVNCAAIPAEMFESEMFGHERGSFTGAARLRKGMFEMAHGGTLFLDEVGDLSLPNQARLLRAVETGTFRRLGGESEIRVDVRIVSATNRTLPDANASYFRTDLYHRLSGLELRVPTLCERRQDIPELAQFYLDEYGRHAPAHPRAFSREAMDQIMAYNWPGNIRELRNVVERACYNAHRDVIAATDLNIAPPPAPDAPPEDALESAERRHIIAVLEQYQWRVADAARVLNLSKSTMYYKLSKHHIDVRKRRT